MSDATDYRPYEELTTPREKALWTRRHRKVQESSKLKRNVSTGDRTAGGNALTTARNYRPQNGPRVLRADQLRKGMIVTPVGSRSRFTVNEVSKGKGRATLVNGAAYPAHVGFRIVSDVARPKPKRKPQSAPEPLRMPVAQPRPVVTVKADTGLKPAPNLAVRSVWERDKRCGIIWSEQ